MKNNWNIVETKNNTNLVWVDVALTNYQEIKDMESQLNAEAYFCKQTNSVLIETPNTIEVPKNTNYNELLMVSRYLNKDVKISEALNS